MGRELTREEAILYGLAFPNSPYAQERLVSGRLPTTKGFYQVGEEFLKEIQVVLPIDRTTGEKIIASVKRLVAGLDTAKVKSEEAVLYPLIMLTLKATE